MKNITVYDIEENKIEKLCNEYDITEAELIEALLEAIEDNNINITDYI